MYRRVKDRPDQFNRESINKSFFTLGILALALIVFVGLLILVSRQ
jgi:hypothetical protein